MPNNKIRKVWPWFTHFIFMMNTQLFQNPLIVITDYWTEQNSIHSFFSLPSYFVFKLYRCSITVFNVHILMYNFKKKCTFTFISINEMIMTANGYSIRPKNRTRIYIRWKRFEHSIHYFKLSIFIATFTLLTSLVYKLYIGKTIIKCKKMLFEWCFIIVSEFNYLLFCYIVYSPLPCVFGTLNNYYIINRQWTFHEVTT